jgi:hypothetical protein
MTRPHIKLCFAFPRRHARKGVGLCRVDTENPCSTRLLEHEWSCVCANFLCAKCKNRSAQA